MLFGLKKKTKRYYGYEALREKKELNLVLTTLNK